MHDVAIARDGAWRAMWCEVERGGMRWSEAERGQPGKDMHHLRTLAIHVMCFESGTVRVHYSVGHAVSNIRILIDDCGDPEQSQFDAHASTECQT